MVVLFSVTEAASLKEAEDVLENLWKSGDLNNKAVILVVPVVVATISFVRLKIDKSQTQCST